MLRADLQQYYHIDLDRAISGEHSAAHVAALVTMLPLESRLARNANPDNAWTLTDVLIACVLNVLRGYVWGISDKRKRGPRPQLVGPSWMLKNKRTLPSRVLPIEQLMKELSKPRKAS